MSFMKLFAARAEQTISKNVTGEIAFRSLATEAQKPMRAHDFGRQRIKPLHQCANRLIVMLERSQQIHDTDPLYVGIRIDNKNKSGITGDLAFAVLGNRTKFGSPMHLLECVSF
jgi:hypothetical protein